MIKVSIIVPVYNVERYLERCLNSLVSQTLKELELIIVDDGSTDDSNKIIQKYEARFEQVHCFKKENGGLSDARNYGMQFCKGKYIGFVDSDDFVEPNMFELLYKKAEKDQADIVECNLFHTFDSSQDVELGEEIYDKKKMLMFGRSVVWNKIYNREWLEKTKVLFHKGLIYEDVEFYLKLIPHIHKYSYIKEPLIHYVQRTESLNNYSTLKTMDIFQILNTIYDYYKENGYLNEYQDALELFYTRILLCSSLLRICKIKDSKERKTALKCNWNCLNDTFPSWKKNIYLKRDAMKHKFFMRSMNRVTYKIYSWILSASVRIKRR